MIKKVHVAKRKAYKEMRTIVTVETGLGVERTCKPHSWETTGKTDTCREKACRKQRGSKRQADKKSVCS